MAKGKSALAAALERDKGGSGSFNTRRLGLSFAVGALACFALGALWQAVAVTRHVRARAQLETAQQNAVASIGEIVANARRRIKIALDDDELHQAVYQLDDQGRMRASVRLKQRIDGLLAAEVFAPDLPELFTTDLAKFGYAKASILANARGAADGVSAAQIHVVNGGRQALAMAQAVTGSTGRLAFVYVLMPADELLKSIEDAPVSLGRIELRQGGRVVNSLVAGRGDVQGYEIGATHSDPIANSILTVAIQVPRPFEIGEILPLFNSQKVVLLLAEALFAALASAILWLIRRHNFAPHARARPLPAFLSKLRSRVSGAPSDRVEEGYEPASELASPAPSAARKIVTAAPAAAGSGVEVEELPARPTAAPAPMLLERNIFRAYDIRGVVGSTLTQPVARAIGQSIGSMARDRGLREIAVGRDGRHSGKELSAALIGGLRKAGIDVTDVGMVPTPTLYFATFHLNTGSGVMVTGSHNPPDYNGFKVVLGGETLAEDQIQEIFARIVENRLLDGQGGLQQLDVKDDYIERITGDIQIERRLKVVVDAGNGVAGAIAPTILEGIGCEVVPLYCEVDGDFPNHHPDPSDPHNLQDLISSVKQFGADLGIAFDGDGDRLGVVTAEGEIIYPDRTLMLFAADVLLRNPGAPIIYDVKCTGHLQNVILRHGGSPIMWKTGHSLIKAKMKEEGAELAGEMSGHFFFKERWYGFDDGIYAAARLCEILAADERPPQAVFDELPKGVSTPELKVAMEEGRHYAFMAKFRDKASFPGARISTIDGVRADYADGWGLVRCSNTTPSLVLRFDADNQAALSRIQAAYREQILAVDPTLQLPF